MAILFWTVQYSYSQEIKSDSLRRENIILDSLFLAETEEPKPNEKPKVLHAEPLYIDLIRDLGARKGEKEWNIGMGMTDKRGFDEFEALIEYEWAVIDRLGLEIELPATFFSKTNQLSSNIEKPSNRLESLKLASQWSFLVSEKAKTTLALGYLHEFKLADLNKWGEENLYKGNIFNPFFVAAKRWGNNFHTLLYTGPAISQHFSTKSFHTSWQINSNFHYMISGTRNFIGIEFNKEINHNNDFDMTIRPQMRVGIADNLMIGIVTGIPVNRENERFSSFLRLIYEPSHSKH